MNTENIIAAALTDRFGPIPGLFVHEEDGPQVYNIAFGIGENHRVVQWDMNRTMEGRDDARDIIGKVVAGMSPWYVDAIKKAQEI